MFFVAYRVARGRPVHHDVQVKHFRWAWRAGEGWRRESPGYSTHLEKAVQLLHNGHLEDLCQEVPPLDRRHELLGIHRLDVVLADRVVDEGSEESLRCPRVASQTDLLVPLRHLVWGGGLVVAIVSQLGTQQLGGQRVCGATFHHLRARLQADDVAEPGFSQQRNALLKVEDVGRVRDAAAHEAQQEDVEYLPHEDGVTDAPA